MLLWVLFNVIQLGREGVLEDLVPVGLGGGGEEVRGQTLGQTLEPGASQRYAAGGVTRVLELEKSHVFAFLNSLTCTTPTLRRGAAALTSLSSQKSH